MNRTRLAALLAALCVMGSLSACTPAVSDPPSSEPAVLQWTIVDDQAGDRSGWNGKAMTQVFAQLEQIPEITRYTGDQNQYISNLLVNGGMPDLITVPSNSRLREKLMGSGNWYGIRELSETLYNSIPEDIRRYYQKNADDLYALPGGYTAEGYEPVSVEGLFVREEYYHLLDSPSFATLSDMKAALSAFVDMMVDNQLLPVEQLLPLVFGVNNSGFDTVEHLCGVTPLYRENGNTYHRLFHPNTPRVLQFFDELDFLSAHPIFGNYSADRLTELLKTNVFVYIGPAEFIQQFNRENPRSAYVAVTPPLAEDGFLEAQSRYGRYETFVSRNCDPEQAVQLLSVLSSAEASCTFMYGVEDETWIRVNGEVTLLKTAIKAMEDHAESFLQQTGIAAFPFLSRNGALNPYMVQPDTVARDITADRVLFVPGDYHYYYVSEMDRRLWEYYEEVAGPSVTPSDIDQRIQVFSGDKEPLTVAR